jgi:hypothetical protein
MDEFYAARVVDVLAGGDLVSAADQFEPEPDTATSAPETTAARAPEIAASTPPTVAQRPAPETELSVEQRRIRDLEHRLALELGRKDVEPEELEPAATSGPTANIVIHFVDDGLTALGKVWRRGQELEFTPGSRAYHDTVDRSGQSWLELRGDEAAQQERYGRVMFRDGPWTGKGYDEIATATFEPLKPLTSDGTPPRGPTPEELATAAKAEAARRRAAPILPAR